MAKALRRRECDIKNIIKCPGGQPPTSTGHQKLSNDPADNVNTACQYLNQKISIFGFTKNKNLND